MTWVESFCAAADDAQAGVTTGATRRRPRPLISATLVPRVKPGYLWLYLGAGWNWKPCAMREARRQDATWTVEAKRITAVTKPARAAIDLSPQSGCSLTSTRGDGSPAELPGFACSGPGTMLAAWLVDPEPMPRDPSRADRRRRPRGGRRATDSRDSSSSTCPTCGSASINQLGGAGRSGWNRCESCGDLWRPMRKES